MQSAIQILQCGKIGVPPDANSHGIPDSKRERNAPFTAREMPPVSPQGTEALLWKHLWHQDCETSAMPPDPESADVLELQEVLTRYIDSRDGYLQAAELAEDTGLSAAFAAIAERREKIAGKIAATMGDLGNPPDLDGSPEAGLHRWWIRLKERFTSQESKAVISECLRGEKELARTLEDALSEGHLGDAHATLVSEALAEVWVAIRAFENVVEED